MDKTPEKPAEPAAEEKSLYDYDKNMIEIGERMEHVAYRLLGKSWMARTPTPSRFSARAARRFTWTFILRRTPA